MISYTYAIGGPDQKSHWLRLTFNQFRYPQEVISITAIPAHYMIHIPPSLHHRRFRLLWLGLLISIAGSQMQLWALFWHIRTITDQPIALGAVGLARILPVIVFSLIGGAVADMLNRRRILFLTQTGMALVAFALGWLTLAGHIDLWHIYLLTALQAVAQAFDGPARQALVPNLVPASDLPNAFSLNSIANQIGSIVGPALSGIIIAAGGLPYVYIINAISFLAVILALVMMGPVEQQKTQPHPEWCNQLLSHCRRGTLYPEATAHPIHHDPGFLRHLLRLGQYAHADHRRRCSACGGGSLWMALSSPGDWSDGGSIDHLADA